MREANTKIVNLVGTPSGWIRVGFTAGDGRAVVAMVRMASDWDVEVHVDETTWTSFCVGVSLDKQQVVAERWLDTHVPRRLKYNDITEQQAAMGGQDATTLDHAGIVSALQSALTSGDTPAPLPPRVLNLTQVDDTHATGMVGPDFERHGDIYFSERSGKPVWWFPLGGRREAMRTQSSVTNTRYVYHNGPQEIFFLFEIGPDYLLEHVRPWGGVLQRRHVRVAKTSVTATQPTDLVEELDPQLVHDPDAFA